MEFRVIDAAAKRPARFSSCLSASRSRLLALSASAAFMVLPGEMARAQETTDRGAAEEKTVSPEAGSNGRAQAGAGANGANPESQGANGAAATESSVPPVIVDRSRTSNLRRRSPRPSLALPPHQDRALCRVGTRRRASEPGAL